jgi:hypothetical protein
MITSYMALVNYTFKGNIFLDGTIRREGSSRFGEDNRWGTFYSLGGSWVFSDESFMAGTSSWLNTSKIRASYGITGNAGVGINSYQSLLSYSSSYNDNPGAFPSNPGNAALTWEKAATLNFGLDFGIFNRVTGSFEYFIRKNTDLLLDVPLSYTTGFSTQTQNVGAMENKGWELTLSADVIKMDNFKWNLGGNITQVKNKVTELPVDGNGDEIGISGSTTKVTVGEPVYSYFLRTWAGVDPATGQPLWYVDDTETATTSVYADAEQVLQGRNSIPTFYGSINTRFDFYGVYVGASMYYSTGNNVYDSWAYYTQSDGRFTYGVATGYARQYDRWQQPGDIAPNPQNIWGNTSSSNSNSTRRMYDGTFMRLRDVTVGYDFPKTLVEKAKLTGVNIYVRGTNMWTKTKDPLLEFDPEVRADGSLAINAPPLKSLVFGLKVNF